MNLTTFNIFRLTHLAISLLHAFAQIKTTKEGNIKRVNSFHYFRQTVAGYAFFAAEMSSVHNWPATSLDSVLRTRSTQNFVGLF